MSTKKYLPLALNHFRIHCERPCEQARRTLRERESALREHFAKFFFRLKVYEEYLERLHPLVEEIGALRGKVGSVTPPEITKDQANPAEKIRARLREIELQLRIAPAELVAIVGQATLHVREAHREKTRLVAANLRLVISLAKRYTNRGLSFLDLIQAGNAGLMNAVENFAHRQGARFSIFASWWIRRSITQTILRRPTD